MIKIAERAYQETVGSDVQRDGMFFEVAGPDGEMLAEIFYSDQDGKMTFWADACGLPLELVEWMIREAKERLIPPPSVLPPLSS